MWLRAGVGIVLCVVGVVFVLQGTNVVHGSSMSGEGKWGIIGGVMVAIGLVLLVAAVRFRRSGPAG
jgi:hypothetical protein